MTEKEKMLNYEIYNPNYDEELIKERTLTQDLCFEYNNIMPSNLEKRDDIIRKIINKAGDRLLIEQPFWCDYGYNIEVGDNFYSNHGLTILDGGKVKFGDNVWFGGNVVVVPGVNIGNNVVVGAGSVVTKDIPSDVVVAGNPCRIIKYLNEGE